MNEENNFPDRGSILNRFQSIAGIGKGLGVPQLPAVKGRVRDLEIVEISPDRSPESLAPCWRISAKLPWSSELVDIYMTRQSEKQSPPPTGKYDVVLVRVPKRAGVDSESESDYFWRLSEIAPAKDRSPLNASSPPKAKEEAPIIPDAQPAGIQSDEPTFVEEDDDPVEVRLSEEPELEHLEPEAEPEIVNMIDPSVDIDLDMAPELSIPEEAQDPKAPTFEDITKSDSEALTEALMAQALLNDITEPDLAATIDELVESNTPPAEMPAEVPDDIPAEPEPALPDMNLLDEVIQPKAPPQQREKPLPEERTRFEQLIKEEARRASASVARPRPTPRQSVPRPDRSREDVPPDRPVRQRPRSSPAQRTTLTHSEASERARIALQASAQMVAGYLASARERQTKEYTWKDMVEICETVADVFVDWIDGSVQRQRKQSIDHHTKAPESEATRMSKVTDALADSFIEDMMNKNL